MNSERGRQLWVCAILLLSGTVILWAGIGIMAGKALQTLSFFSATLFQDEQTVYEEKDQKPLRGFRLLDGVEVQHEYTALFPVGVMIENSVTTRPQAGLSRASMVYETVVEGLITRFLVVFDPAEFPETIGPVRSIRPYYNEWISELQAISVHAGGSPQALSAIDGLGIKDINALRNGPYFWRDTAKRSPHNLFTSKKLLNAGISDHGWKDGRASFSPWMYRDDIPFEERPDETKTIKIHFSAPSYDVVYEYKKEKNAYLRINGGKPHQDSNTQEDMFVRNVIVVEIPPIAGIGEKGRLTLIVTGEGKALVARQGESIEGTWRKSDRLSRMRFYDAQGREIVFARGSTWIHILPQKTGAFSTE